MSPDIMDSYEDASGTIHHYVNGEYVGYSAKDAFGNINHYSLKDGYVGYTAKDAFGGIHHYDLQQGYVGDSVPDLLGNMHHYSVNGGYAGDSYGSPDALHTTLFGENDGLFSGHNAWDDTPDTPPDDPFL